MNEMLITSVICPKCDRECDPRARSCPWCNSELVRGSASAAAPAPRPITDRFWFIVIVLLHLGVLGIPYYLKVNYSLRARLALCAASVFYTALVMVVVAWGMFQISRVFTEL